MPVDDIESIGFVRRIAIPAFEYLFAGVVVTGGPQIRIVKPISIRIIARAAPSHRRSPGSTAIGELEALMRLWSDGGFVENRESKKNGNEADKRE